MEDSLSGKTALVTGGGRGIGAAIATKLASMGARVTICGRDRSRLDQTAKASGCEAVTCDVGDWKSVEAMAAGVQERHGRLDILVNNAGVAHFGVPLLDLSLDRW